MNSLLAARDRRLMRGHRSRRDDLYGSGQLFGRLMRHLPGLASIEVTLLPGGVLGAASVAALVSPSRRTHRIAASSQRAQLAAVAVAVIAKPANEEDLAATRAADEAKRFHG
jgi:hypothetical protein